MTRENVKLMNDMKGMRAADVNAAAVVFDAEALEWS